MHFLHIFPFREMDEGTGMIEGQVKQIFLKSLALASDNKIFHLERYFQQQRVGD